MGAIKYRSLIDYAAILAGDRQGYNLGLDGSIFIREELTPGTFNAPRIGTQGDSAGATSASTDISLGPDTDFNIVVDGGSTILVTLALPGNVTGALIEVELETKINSALAAAGEDARVWVDFDGAAPDRYTVTSQKTGLTSTVVITDAGALNIADDLNLGTANAGTETAGTDDQDFLLYTSGGPTFNQPVESNSHRTGRFHTGIVKKKKVAEFDFDAMLNMSGSAGDSIDSALRVLLKNIFGKETVVAGTSIDYTVDTPNQFFTMVRVSTIFGEYYNGGYAKDYTLTQPGDDATTQKFTGRARDASIAGIAEINGAVVASDTIIVNAAPFNQAERYTVGARVMFVGTDGRTITAGADGSITLLAVTTGSSTLQASTTLDLDDASFIVPWHPGAVQQTGRDNIFTDLEGSIKLSDSSPEICVTNISLGYVNDHIDVDNCFGIDRNDGYVAGNRATLTLSVTADMSNENMGDLVQARQFGGFSPTIIIGDSAARHLEIKAVKWIVGVPEIDLPENGTTPITFEGILYQSNAGARDPITYKFK